MNKITPIETDAPDRSADTDEYSEFDRLYDECIAQIPGEETI